MLGCEGGVGVQGAVGEDEIGAGEEVAAAAAFE